MKYFKNYQMFTEAIDIQDVRKYLAVKREKNVIKLLDKIFKNLKRLPGAERSKRDERIYIPFKSSSEEVKGETQKWIETILSGGGYEIIDYKKGLAKKGKNIFKIGKLLRKSTNPNHLKSFVNDPMREGSTIEDSYIVFSRHAYDIAGMSTNRGWDSCMNIYTGVYKEYVESDISKGTIVAYLIRGNDRNINKPIARIAIKPYINQSGEDDDIIYFKEVVYPSSTDPRFGDQVEEILSKIQNAKLTEYSLKRGLYCDTEFYKIPDIKPRNKEEVEFLVKHYNITDYIVNDDLSVDVNKSINLAHSELKKIPFKFRKVNGNFNISDNKLTSLEGCPDEVDGDFQCRRNNLTTLEGAPRIIKGGFYCDQNKLISLEGGPQIVGTNYHCNNNNLKSLKGSPERIKYDFDCSHNKLTTLIGSPSDVGGDFRCQINNLTSLEGGPKNVGEDYMCFATDLTSLKGSPQYIDGDFDCSTNGLRSLEGGPKKVEGSFECDNNQLYNLIGSPQQIGNKFSCKRSNLVSLEGGPRRVEGDYNVMDNRLSNLIGSPEYVGANFVCSTNNLISFEGAPKEIGQHFWAFKNSKEFKEEDIRSISNIQGNVRL